MFLYLVQMYVPLPNQPHPELGQEAPGAISMVDPLVGLVVVTESFFVGCWEAGLRVGCDDFFCVGLALGNRVGLLVGTCVGLLVGRRVGRFVGSELGNDVGCFVGFTVG